MNLLVLSGLIGVAFALDDLRLYRQNVRLRRVNRELRREVGARRRQEFYAAIHSIVEHRAARLKAASATPETGR